VEKENDATSMNKKGVYRAQLGKRWRWWWRWVNGKAQADERRRGRKRERAFAGLGVVTTCSTEIRFLGGRRVS